MHGVTYPISWHQEKTRRGEEAEELLVLVLRGGVYFRPFVWLRRIRETTNGNTLTSTANFSAWWYYGGSLNLWTRRALGVCFIIFRIRWLIDRAVGSGLALGHSILSCDLCCNSQSTYLDPGILMASEVMCPFHCCTAVWVMPVKEIKFAIDRAQVGAATSGVRYSWFWYICFRFYCMKYEFVPSNK